ncbi:hypothetical protein KP509_13G064900 [Ceratopteris richardii]|uniref:Uncharacterized protein n=1 Tax=Ceratopteris richardii TaxID=49495 RepID=A0A8T2TG68_CERRI|nr:hypothetical protein KP509_13G064900 [Ceratopteris richardii]
MKILNGKCGLLSHLIYISSQRMVDDFLATATSWIISGDGFDNRNTKRSWFNCPL